MQVPRDLSRRMLEAAEGAPVVDVHERLIPESWRVNQRIDFLAWFVAHARPEIQSLGLSAQDMDMLGDVQADPEERWQRCASCWPYLRATMAGRTVLRVAWELFGEDDLNERTWKNMSARMWRASEPGFYHDLLVERSRVQMTLVDNAIDPDTRTCCAPIVNVDALLAPRGRLQLEDLSDRLDVQLPVNQDLLDAMVTQFTQSQLEAACVSFKVSTLSPVDMPTPEQVAWALGRVLGREEAEVPHPVEPALQTWLLHCFLSRVGPSGCPVQVCVDSSDTVERLASLAQSYGDVPFVCIYEGGADPFSLLRLARSVPNVTLAVGVWQTDPQLALRALRSWLHGVPQNKIFAVGGNWTMVEAVCAQAMMLRERIAALFAEMVAGGDLDEGDAMWAMERVLHENATEYFGLQVPNGTGQESSQ